MTSAVCLLCRFSSVLQGLYKADNLTMFAIDEAHCISRYSSDLSLSLPEQQALDNFCLHAWWMHNTAEIMRTAMLPLCLLGLPSMGSQNLKAQSWRQER